VNSACDRPRSMSAIAISRIAEAVINLQVLESRAQFELVGARGFEPRTPCAQGRCATRLRYAPTVVSLDFTL